MSYAEDSTFAIKFKRLCSLSFVGFFPYVVELFSTVLESQYNTLLKMAMNILHLNHIMKIILSKELISF